MRVAVVFDGAQQFRQQAELVERYRRGSGCGFDGAGVVLCAVDGKGGAWCGRVQMNS